MSNSVIVVAEQRMMIDKGEKTLSMLNTNCFSFIKRSDNYCLAGTKYLSI